MCIQQKRFWYLERSFEMSRSFNKVVAVVCVIAMVVAGMTDYLVKTDGAVETEEMITEETTPDEIRSDGTDPENYCWSDDVEAKETTKTLTFEIEQADNEWTEELSIENWVYGEEAKAPVAEAKFGEVVFTYSTDMEGEFTEIVPENAGTYYVKAEVAGTDNYKGISAIKSFVIEQAEQEAPEGIEKIDTTLENNADGKIIGVTSNMEYRAETDEIYTAIKGEEITGLTAGTYYIRYKEIPNYKPSEDVKVIIKSGRKLNINFPKGEGFKIEPVGANTLQVGYGDSYFFKIIVYTGYEKGTSFVVKADGEKLTASSEGTYTIINITDDVDVVVQGVKKSEQTSPAATTSVIKNNFTVKFNYSGGTGSKMSKNVTNGKKYGALPTTRRRKYLFDGWYTAKMGGKKITDITVVNLKENQTLYAQK